jgi:hypothetical protein
MGSMYIAGGARSSHPKLACREDEHDGEPVTLFWHPFKVPLVVDGIVSRPFVDGNPTSELQPMFITTNQNSVLKHQATMVYSKPWTQEDETAWLECGWLS